MKKAIILYASVHHQNTKKLIESVKSQNVTIQDVSCAKSINLSEYDVVGFASGIYMGKMHRTIEEFIENNKGNLSNKKTFLIATCGGTATKGLEKMADKLKAYQAEVVGTFWTHGYDTYGPFKLIGGIRKKHPDAKSCITLVGLLGSVIPRVRLTCGVSLLINTLWVR